MIASITLENFFSFGPSTTIELSPGVNILLGINGSGKSNFLKAIRLLYDAVVGEGLEKTFLRDWGGFGGVAHYGREVSDEIRLTFEFDLKGIAEALGNKGYQFQKNPIYALSIFRSGTAGYYLGEKLYTESMSAKHKTPYTFMDISQGKGILNTWAKGKMGIQKYPQGGDIAFKDNETVLRQVSDPERYYPMFTLKRALEQIAAYDYFDTTLKSPIRQPSMYDTNAKLAFNGQNLVSILNRMKNHHLFAYEEVEQALQKINPYFKDLSFELIGTKILLMLREKGLSKSVPVENISDGTLRYLLLLAILLNPERGGLLCIDEPEIGLHPDMIRTIAAGIKQASAGSQFLIATHSPLLVNDFEVEDVLVFEKNDRNQTEVSMKQEEDFEPLDSNTLTGQLWLRGKMGGTRW
jgi:predicted ATPase